MKILFYKNQENSIRVFLNQEENYNNYTLEIGEEYNPNPFYFPGEFVNNVPDSEEKISSFEDEIRKFNPLIFKSLEKVKGLKIIGKESDLIKALRETKKCAEKEKEFEAIHPIVIGSPEFRGKN